MGIRPKIHKTQIDGETIHLRSLRYSEFLALLPKEAEQKDNILEVCFYCMINEDGSQRYKELSETNELDVQAAQLIYAECLKISGIAGEKKTDSPTPI